MQYKTVAPRAIVNNIHIMVLYLQKKKNHYIPLNMNLFSLEINTTNYIFHQSTDVYRNPAVCKMNQAYSVYWKVETQKNAIFYKEKTWGLKKVDFRKEMIELLNGVYRQ